MEELHLGHPGSSRIKALARSYVWWPNMEKELESKVKECEECQAARKLPPQAPLHIWDWPERPWSRLHADYAGPFMGKMFLVVVDAHSKWIEAKVVDSATSQHTIQLMRTMFATHGLPELLVTDNGSVFTSSEFEDFMRKNGVRHVTSAPYHPATNGLAERAVQTLKEGLKKLSGGSIVAKLDRFLFQYRLTPHSTTGTAPAELLLGRRPRCRLDLLHPDTKSKVRHKQEKQKAAHDRKAKLRSMEVRDKVFVKNFSQGPRWLPGWIVDSLGSRSLQVKLADGRVVRRHMDHVRVRSTSDGEQVREAHKDDDGFSLMGESEEGEEMQDPLTPQRNETQEFPNEEEGSSQATWAAGEQEPETVQQEQAPQPPEPIAGFQPRRSQRNRQPPDYYAREHI